MESMKAVKIKADLASSTTRDGRLVVSDLLEIAYRALTEASVYDDGRAELAWKLAEELEPHFVLQEVI